MFTLLGSLGIDPPLLLAQVVNFSILLVLLWKFLYHPIMARIEADEALLERVEKQKADLEDEAARFAVAHAAKEAALRRQAESTIHDAEEIAHEIRDRARDEARAEKDAVIAQIRARLTNVSKDHAA